MKIISSGNELKSHIRTTDLTPLGFVPTMGALHDGHLSLVRKAISECSLVIVSIFVNPNQFNEKSDLSNYPRTPEADLALLRPLLREADVVFMPGETEIYPEPDKRKFNFGNLDKVMEARHRPGHFNGVAQVVSRLFDIVCADKAYFGQKDFQQLAVIKELVRQLGYKTEIIPNPIIREPGGLAMSSRNTLLEPGIRPAATVIYKSISEAAGMVAAQDIAAVKEYVIRNIEADKRFRVEYFEIADEVTLTPLSSVSEMAEGLKYYCCIAVMAGGIRLIDNIEVPLPLIRKG
jgi:pantoate--beta-alanine ligase